MPAWKLTLKSTWVLANVLGSFVKLFWKQENGASLHEVIFSVESKYDLAGQKIWNKELLSKLGSQKEMDRFHK